MESMTEQLLSLRRRPPNPFKAFVNFGVENSFNQRLKNSINIYLNNNIGTEKRTTNFIFQLVVSDDLARKGMPQTHS